MVSLTLLSTITSLTLRIKTDVSQLLAGNLTLSKRLLRGSNAAGGDPQEVVRLVVIDVLEESVEPALLLAPAWHILSSHGSTYWLSFSSSLCILS